MTFPQWKARLAAEVEPELLREIEIFHTEVELRKAGKLDEKVFAETRLRRGAYGQRYDNGQRHDGVVPRRLDYPSGELTKGPSTLWDAPGMQRVKLPFGGLTCEQMEVLADVAEEYADAILHVTTRQDVQLHFVHIEDTPELMLRLAAVGVTTREACGNSVRNVTACHLSGVCSGEPFDVTPYAKAIARFLLGHPDTQDFGRKFKIAFSGCADEACGLTGMHDLGAIAVTRPRADGSIERGFAVYIGGGLGSVPQQAKLYDEFVPETELLPLAQALARVFARLGEKKNRARARLKFLVAKLGLEETKRLVVEERARLPHDPRWTAFLADIDRPVERRAEGLVPLGKGPRGARFGEWRARNVTLQRQEGYAVAIVRLPLGDLSSSQLRALAGVARRFVGDTVRATVDQNLALRWVKVEDLPALHAELEAIGLAAPGAGTIADVTACPGTDTCKLGISSSRGLAAELGRRLDESGAWKDEATGDLAIKVSGCFNACGQHHIAELGFWGVQRKVAGRTVPHFQVVLGGETAHNAGAFGLAIGAVPSKNVPKVVDRLTAAYREGRREGESFSAFVERTGKAKLRAMLEDLFQVPPAAEDASFYSDWGDPREYTIGDLGVGECAGEVVRLVDFELAAAEREAFEASLALERGEPVVAAEGAYKSMIRAARALVREITGDLADDPAVVVPEFRARLVETKLFSDPFAGDKFASYLFRVHGRPFDDVSAERARQRVEEATLFLEAAHACYGRMTTPTEAS